MSEKDASVGSRKQEEIFGILLLTFGMLILVSVISYFMHPEETPEGMSQVQNAMGIAGVYIANLLVKYLLGRPAIIVPLLLMAWGWNRFRTHATQPLLRHSLYLLVAALYLATLFAMPYVMDPEGSKIGYSWSGLVGGFIAQLLHKAFGNFGSLIILLAAAVMIFIWFSRLSLDEAYEKVRSGSVNLGKWSEQAVSAV